LTNLQNKKIQNNMWFQQYITCKTKQHWLLKAFACDKKIQGTTVATYEWHNLQKISTKYIWFQNKTNQIDKGPCSS
jgi:hypothetical protein